MALNTTQPLNDTSPPNIKKVQEDNKSILYWFDEFWIWKIKASCRRTFYQSLLNGTPVAFLNLVVNFEATLLWAHKHNNGNEELIPKSLFDRKLNISLLNFPKIRQQLSQELAIEASTWIQQKLNIYLYKTNEKMSNSEYCNVWSDLSNSVYPGIDTQSEWRDINRYRNLEFTPRPQALRGLCLNLIERFYTNI